MNDIGANRFYIVTGGPGSGKTSLIEALRAQGYYCAVEAGREIIQDQVRIDGRALPWRDPLLFAELMLCCDMRSYRLAELSSGPVFLDRGIPDIAGYLRLMNIPVPTHLQKAVQNFGYNRTVFIAPPWPEIFCQDQERKQDLNEAQRTYEAIATTYQAHSYELLELPRFSIEERCRFVLDHVQHRQ